MTSAVGAGCPDVCVHLAGITTVAAARNDEAQAWSVNLHGTLALARAILRFAPACSMIFASTADAYGTGQGAISEDVPLAPLNLYAASKAVADLALGGDDSGWSPRGPGKAIQSYRSPESVPRSGCRGIRSAGGTDRGRSSGTGDRRGQP